jgi:hypothetical protein
LRGKARLTLFEYQRQLRFDCVAPHRTLATKSPEQDSFRVTYDHGFRFRVMASDHPISVGNRSELTQIRFKPVSFMMSNCQPFTEPQKAPKVNSPDLAPLTLIPRICEVCQDEVCAAADAQRAFHRRSSQARLASVRIRHHSCQCEETSNRDGIRVFSPPSNPRQSLIRKISGRTSSSGVASQYRRRMV